MLHPLISAFLAKPYLFFEHMAAYVALAGEEMATAKRSLISKVLAWVVVGAMVLVSIIGACTAAMLRVVHGADHWVFWVTPAVPLVLALCAWLFIVARPAASAFADIKAQASADLLLLQESGEPS